MKDNIDRKPKELINELSSGLIPVYSLRELRRLNPPSYLIHRVIPESGLVYLVAEPSSKKTFVAIHMACCVQTGTSFFEKPVKRGNVVYVAAEGQSGIQKRITAWQKAQGVVVPEDMFSVIPIAINLADRTKQTELINVLLQREKSLGSIDFIVIDTLSRCLLGDENSAKEMTAFVDICTRLIQKFKCSVLVVHHPAKSGNGGARGHSSLEGAADQGLAIRNGKRDHFILKLDAKPPKDDEPAPDLYLKAAIYDLSLDLGFNDEGKPISSLSLELDESIKVKEVETVEVKSKKQALIDLIMEILKKGPLSRSEICYEIAGSSNNFSDKTISRALSSMLNCGVLWQPKHGKYELA